MTPLPFPRRLRAGLCSRALALALAASLVGGLVGGPLQAQTGRNVIQNGDFIVAVVNTEAVTAIEVAQRIERIQGDAKRSNSTLPNADSLRQQVLDALIDERVQITYARESGAKVDETEVDRAIANIASQNQISVVQLRDRLRSEGLMDRGRFTVGNRVADDDITISHGIWPLSHPMPIQWLATTGAASNSVNTAWLPPRPAQAASHNASSLPTATTSK